MKALFPRNYAVDTTGQPIIEQNLKLLDRLRNVESNVSAK